MQEKVDAMRRVLAAFRTADGMARAGSWTTADHGRFAAE
jgi:hypothetical protein